MNAHTTISKAVLASSADTYSGTNAFLADFHATAKQIGEDIRAGRKVMTEHGIFTPEDLAQRVAIDGGYFYPTRSCGPDADAALRSAGL